ncbi:MAG: response regulator transcription factor [Dethiobacter sp.]|nr:response regulator transcription factor [Dethiobacter sp.]MBS3901108.1 response regulator transcription factor [Dethiobacter sp.]
MTFRVYLVEDEANLNSLLVSYFEREGWNVTPFLTGESARQAIPTSPDLWILDIMLPDIDGYQLISEIKELTPHVPVIFISARDAGLDRIIGLEKGSDDYLPKPFLPRELAIRARKLLERMRPSASSIEATHPITLPPYRIEPLRRIVTKADGQIELTAKEFDLLMLFAAQPGRAFSREQILVQIWGDAYFGSDRVVDDLVRRLRKKAPALHIETIYGFGYRLASA